jgi:hypothetical protein
MIVKGEPIKAPLFQVFLEIVGLVITSGVAGPVADAVAVSETEHAVFAALFSVSLLCVVLVYVFVVAVSPSQIPVDISVDPEVAVSAVVEPEIFVVSEPVVSVDIVLAFVVLIPVSVVAIRPQSAVLRIR